MLLSDPTSVPGIPSVSDFNAWLSLAGISHHPDVSIGQSVLGGTGLFLNGNALSPTPSIVLRVPSGATYNLTTCMALLQAVMAWEGDRPELAYRESEVIKYCLTALAPLTELAVLQAYFVAFAVLASGAGEHETSPLRSVDPYTSILCLVPVPTLDADPPAVLRAALEHLSNPKVVAHISHALRSAERFSALRDGITEFLPPGFAPFTLTTFTQINAAVKSRVLEIPEADPSHSDDFCVSVTLVPLLDFANHSHHPNAFFDVDRATGDVVLKTDQAVWGEVLISYALPADAAQMAMTYGFIPEGVAYELPLPRLPLLQWLKVMPVVQVVCEGEEVIVNLVGDLLPVMFSGVEYDPKWVESVLGGRSGYEEGCGDLIPNRVHRAVVRNTVTVPSGTELWDSLQPAERDSCWERYRAWLSRVAVDKADATPLPNGNVSVVMAFERSLWERLGRSLTFQAMEVYTPLRAPPRVDFEFVGDNISLYEAVTAAAGGTDISVEQQMNADYESLCAQFPSLG